MKTIYYLVFAIIGATASSVLLMATDSYAYNTIMSISGVQSTYVPSDISKSNPDIHAGIGTSSLSTTEIRDVKDQVVYTIKGKVLEIGNPIPWTDNAGNEKGIIPVSILVDKAYKGKLDHGKTFTVYLDGIKIDGEYYLPPGEALFEIGENVLVHAALSNTGPDGMDVYYVKLGEFGKYRINGDKAYNEKLPYGITIDSAARQAK